ncbi:MAG: hypothetical protein K9G67_14095 [Bacteroidales bacterium]|nr:hypothetical protein [Bacteroidales bacterium]MCF8352184.1 hypothetical protein [Bacteroidales bacterium]MCF8377484.1 hypothetical protein [Bacteroidales bacterium]MCF8401607.1 hypothetical protein [Bacteroidales bacterium]
MTKISGFIEKLKKRWGIHSNWQVVVILIVFALTGFSTLYVEEQILFLLPLPEKQDWWVGLLIFIFLTMPLYNLILLVWGFLFGQFKFFWNFEKRFFGRIFGIRRK